MSINLIDSWYVRVILEIWAEVQSRRADKRGGRSPRVFLLRKNSEVKLTAFEGNVLELIGKVT